MAVRRNIFIVVALFGIWAGTIYLAFYPGAMSVDSFVQLEHARASKFSDAYPPMMSLIWRELLVFSDGPEAFLALLVGGFAGGLGLIAFALAQRHGRSAIVLAGLVLAWPPVLGIIGVLWIDILMASALILAIGLVASSQFMPHALQRLAWVGAATCFFVAVGARHNAVAAALPLAVWSMLIALGPHIGRVRIMMATLLGIALTAIMFLATAALTEHVTDEKKHLWVTLAAYDLIGIGVRAHDYERLDIFLPATPADLDVLYSARSWLPLTFGKQIHAPASPFPAATPIPIDALRSYEESRQQLAALWASSIAKHPGAYFRHRLAVFGSLIGLPPWTELWGPVFTRIDGSTLGISARGDTWFAQVMSPFVRMGIFAPWLHLILCVGVFAAASVRAFRTHEPAATLAAALAASGLLHMAGLAATAMSADYRYSHWMIVAAVLSAGVLAASFNKLSGFVEKPETGNVE